MIKKNFLFWFLFLCGANFIFATALEEEQEAESATLSGTYTTVTNANASGGSFVKLQTNSPKGVLQISLPNILSNGVYKLEVYSFNGGASVDLDMSINGGAVTNITLDPSNWAYAGTAKSTMLDVNLDSGANTITLTANGSNVLVDKIIVRKDYDIFYVSAAGNDSNNGSMTAPWKTLTKASAAANLLSSGGLLNPGDKLLFNKGDVFEGQLVINCSGTAAKPIEIGSYGTGELPILSGSGNIPTGDFIETIKMTNTSHILMNNIWIKNDRQVGLGWNGSGNTAYGIYITANKWGGVSKGLTFSDLKITDVFTVDMLDWQNVLNTDNHNAHGMFFDSNMDDVISSPTIEVGIDDVLIENCYFYNIGVTGVSIRHLSTGSYNNPIDEEERNMNYVIRNNTFQELGGDGIVFASVCNGLVEHNDFIDLGMGDHDNASDRFYGRGEGCWIWDSRNIIVQFNKQLRAKGFGDTYGTAGHIDFYCKNAIYQYNYSEDTEGGFVEILGDCENSIFRFNVSVNDGHRANGHHRYSIWLSGYVGTGKTPVPSNNNYIYNNTVYLDKSRSKPDIDIFAKNTYIYNNIFYAMNGAKIGAGGVSVDIHSGSELLVSNNLFYGDIASAFKNLDSHKITGQDPLFVNGGSDNSDGYKIQESSPAIDAGKSFTQPLFPMGGIGIFKDVPTYPTEDAFGVSVDIENHNPNIGANNAYNSNLLGVDTPNIEQKMFTIFPNPVKDQINIRLLKQLNSVDISIYDVQGRAIHSTAVKVSKQNFKISVPEALKNGIYFLKIKEDTTQQTTRFILYR